MAEDFNTWPLLNAAEAIESPEMTFRQADSITKKLIEGGSDGPDEHWGVLLIDPERNHWVQIVLIAVFTLLLIIHTKFTLVGVWSQKEMRNIYNMILTSCIYILLFIHISCCTYSLVHTLNHGDPKSLQGIPALTVDYYVYYQLPFDILNIAIVTHIYQWLEIKHTLIYILDM